MDLVDTGIGEIQKVGCERYSTRNVPGDHKCDGMETILKSYHVLLVLSPVWSSYLKGRAQWGLPNVQ